MKYIMKIICALLIMYCLVFAVVGCGRSTDSFDDTTTSTTEQIETTDVQTNLPKSRIGKEVLQYPGKNEDFEYSVYETYVEIDDYLGNESNVVIPETIDGLPVKVVYGFCFNETIRNVTLPESTVVISNCAFDNCINLESINIPEGVTEIGMRAFYDCTSLKSLTIPKSVSKIGELAFGIGSGRYGGKTVIETLIVRFYKGTAAAKYIADSVFDINYEIIDIE